MLKKSVDSVRLWLGVAFGSDPFDAPSGFVYSLLVRVVTPFSDCHLSTHAQHYALRRLYCLT